MKKIILLWVFLIIPVCISAQNRDESYYRSRGYQVFPEFRFAVNCPAVLKDVSRQSNADFAFNYAGGLNENSRTQLVFYQIMIIKLPVGHREMSKNELQDMLMKRFDMQGNGRRVFWGEENYPAYLINYTHNGYTGRGIAVVVNGNIFSFNVITNDDLNSKFNSFTNNVYFY